ncbi:RecQ family ATP-dependent DNA helicase [Kushneria aurantia]|uniref:ATP-dependent DNA helicase RecQ n=1 Tax=Kushneria aurantia TaxID=504092 RepID=A0ABV6G3R7_9GAMM|nr:RecQ family ATP-dependent DNA helicase [Kushneria aurantia]
MTTHDPHATLAEVFGFDTFRDGQQPVVERVVAGRSTAAVFATGAGKSLCYQLSALHLPHLTLVISPLLALMQDQLAFLHRHGIAAATIDSTQPRDEAREVMEQARRGELKILMVSVERLRNERFRRFLSQVPISLMVIDEAHCISEWGHNFRPDYLRLPDYQHEFAIPQALLLTATATPQVIADMRESFAIAAEDVVTTGFYRANLQLEIDPTPADERSARLVEWLAPRQQPGFEAPTVVYVTRQQSAETLAATLHRHGIAALAYHAGLDSETRDDIQRRFMSGEVAVIVATIAFGMGIDKSDIRGVVHFDLPGSIENYSQEIGRAGRDGEPSTCLMLAGRDGLGVLENFVYGDIPERSGIHHVVREIASAGEQPDRHWQVVMHTLSTESNIRTLPLKTLLVQLEMDGVIAPRYTFMAEYRLRYVIEPQALVERFSGERADFVALLVGNIRIARSWGTLDFDRLHNAGREAGIDASRSRVLTALEYFQDKGWVVLEGKRMTDVFEVRAADIDIEMLTDTLHARFRRRADSEIARLDTMLALFESDTCLTRRLALHFGDERAPERCAHCSVCRAGPARLPAAATPPLPDDNRLTALAAPFIAHHREVLGEAPSPERLAHFLCGLAMPVFTTLKARRLDGYAALAGHDYPAVQQRAGAL